MALNELIFFLREGEVWGEGSGRRVEGGAGRKKRAHTYIELVPMGYLMEHSHSFICVCEVLYDPHFERS